MLRRFGAVLACAVVALTLTTPAVSSAGGGCHFDFSESHFEAAGTVVDMKKNCFVPTVLRVEPGAEITFVNRDPVTHQVDGVGWGGTRPLTPGDSMTQRFDDPGTYPFACILHVGMVGAVVVGDGHAQPVAPARAAAADRSSGATTGFVLVGLAALAGVSAGAHRMWSRLHTRRRQPVASS